MMRRMGVPIAPAVAGDQSRLGRAWSGKPLQARGAPEVPPPCGAAALRKSEKEVGLEAPDECHSRSGLTVTQEPQLISLPDLAISSVNIPLTPIRFHAIP